MFTSSCTSATSGLRAWLFPCGAGKTQEVPQQKARTANFYRAAIFAASGTYIAEDFDTGLAVMDMDGVN